MAKIDFGGVWEDVVTRDEFPLKKAKDVLKNEIIAVIGYGVQGPAQSLNMRDNGFKVIIGQAPQFKRDWDKAVKDGWVPGKTLFPIEEAVEEGHDHPVPRLRRRAEGRLADAQEVPEAGRRALLLPRLLHRLQGADRRHPAEGRRRDPGRAEGLGHQRARATSWPRAGINSSYAVFQDATGRAKERTPGRRHRHRLGLPLPDHLRAGGLQRPDRRARRADGRAGRASWRPSTTCCASTATRPSEAFNETVEELTQSLIRLVGENGMDWMYSNCSHHGPARRPRLEAPVQEGRRCRSSRSSTSRVKTGKETAIVHHASTARPTTGRSSRPSSRSMRDSEMWQAGAAVRSLRPENWKKTASKARQEGCKKAAAEGAKSRRRQSPRRRKTAKRSRQSDGDPTPKRRHPQGRRMAGARSLWRANGMRDEQIGKPVIAVVNSFTQFVPGHVHLHEIGQQVKAVDRGAGLLRRRVRHDRHRRRHRHGPRRDALLAALARADRRQRRVHGERPQGGRPGLHLQLRQDHPGHAHGGHAARTSRRSSSPAGPWRPASVATSATTSIDAMVQAADPAVSDEELSAVERAACPTCGCCSGHVHGQLDELPERGPRHGPAGQRHRRGHAREPRCGSSRRRPRASSRWPNLYYGQGDALGAAALDRARKAAFLNAMSLDIAMGGSTNTVLHLLAIAHEAGVDFTMADIDRLSRKIALPLQGRAQLLLPRRGREPRRRHPRASWASSTRGGLLDTSVKRVDGLTLAQALEALGRALARRSRPRRARRYRSAPGGQAQPGAWARSSAATRSWTSTASKGCIRDIAHAYYADGGLAVLYGNLAERGCIVKTAGVDPSIFQFRGPAKVYSTRRRPPATASSAGAVEGGRRGGHPLRGPEGRPRHAGDALPDLLHQEPAARHEVRPRHRRPLLGRHLGALDRPRLARGRRGRGDRAGPGRRRDRDRHQSALGERRAVDGGAC